MCFLAFLQISHSFLFFCRLWLSFSTTVLTAIPPVLEIMYLCVWWVSLMSSFCSSMSSITYPCVSESHFLPQSGVWVKNWTRYFLNASLSPYDRSELCFYCPTQLQLGGCSCFSPLCICIWFIKCNQGFLRWPFVLNDSMKTLFTCGQSSDLMERGNRYEYLATHTPHMLTSWDNLISICLPWI